MTDEPGVYAIGDVVAGTPQLTHVATREGMIAVAHMTGKPAVPINKNRIPGCTYTEPGIGSVGKTLSTLGRSMMICARRPVRRISTQRCPS